METSNIVTIDYNLYRVNAILFRHKKEDVTISSSIRFSENFINGIIDYYFDYRFNVENKKFSIPYKEIDKITVCNRPIYDKCIWFWVGFYFVMTITFGLISHIFFAQYYIYTMVITLLTAIIHMRNKFHLCKMFVIYMKNQKKYMIPLCRKNEYCGDMFDILRDMIFVKNRNIKICIKNKEEKGNEPIYRH